MPLSSRAATILRQLEKLKAGEFVFSGQARGKPLSNMAMEMVLRRMKLEDATVHGFRSSFWGLGWQRLQLHPRVSDTAAADTLLFFRRIFFLALSQIAGDLVHRCFACQVIGCAILVIIDIQSFCDPLQYTQGVGSLLFRQGG